MQKVSDKNLWALISEICAKQRTAADIVHRVFMLLARELEQWLFNFVFHQEFDDSKPLLSIVLVRI